MAAVASGAHILAGTLMAALTDGVDFELPDVNLDDPNLQQPPASGPLYTPPSPITLEALTEGVVGGAGVFDKIVASLSTHLLKEYEANRISGAEYTRAYIAMMDSALQAANQFLLNKDQTYWQAFLVQAQAKTAEAEAIRARVELEIARVNLARAKIEASMVEANYALTKMKLSTEDITYANLVKQGENLDQQTSNLQKQGVGIGFTNSNILPQQEKLLKEQIEVQRAQTSDTRVDGATVTGLVGKQKDLYAQQIDSYKRDSELKIAKVFSDAYITQFTVLEGGDVPSQFSKNSINEVLTKLRQKGGMN